MEKIILKIAIGFLFLFITGAGCEREEDPGEFTEKQILKFSDFGCSDVLWHFKPGYSNTHYIVNSQQELEKYITGDCIPQIDFSKYILIIGHRINTTGIARVDEKLEENNSEVVYTISILKNIAQVAQGISYHAIIEKPSAQKNIRVEVIVKDHE
jgi:hypothetical protein